MGACTTKQKPPLNGHGVYYYGKYKTVRYEGYWCNGKRHGIGSMYYKQNSIIFTGTWDHGDPLHGTLYTPNYVYTGYVSMVKQETRGTKKLKEIDIPVLHGRGVMRFNKPQIDGGVRYEGIWYYGQRDGFFTMTDINRQHFHEIYVEDKRTSHSKNNQFAQMYFG